MAKRRELVVVIQLSEIFLRDRDQILRRPQHLGTDRTIIVCVSINYVRFTKTQNTIANFEHVRNYMIGPRCMIWCHKQIRYIIYVTDMHGLLWISFCVICCCAWFRALVGTSLIFSVTSFGSLPSNTTTVVPVDTVGHDNLPITSSTTFACLSVNFSSP